jgi:uncharacterized membrane protein
MRAKRFDGWLATAVIAHLLISVLHGRAHDGGHVALTAGQSLFVYTVILVGPLVGLAVSFIRARAGGFIVAVTMTTSLLFGLINHFIITSPDHVSQVDPEWRTLFTVTAFLLIASECAGAVAGMRTAAAREVES